MNKTYVNVEYKEKDNAKSKGAKWDVEKKLWYFITNVNIVDNKLNGYEVIRKEDECCVCLTDTIELVIIHDNHKCCKTCLKKLNGKCPLCRMPFNKPNLIDKDFNKMMAMKLRNGEIKYVNVNYEDRYKAKHSGAKYHKNHGWYIVIADVSYDEFLDKFEGTTIYQRQLKQLNIEIFNYSDHIKDYETHPWGKYGYSNPSHSQTCNYEEFKIKLQNSQKQKDDIIITKSVFDAWRERVEKRKNYIITTKVVFDGWREVITKVKKNKNI